MTEANGFQKGNGKNWKVRSFSTKKNPLGSRYENILIKIFQDCFTTKSLKESLKLNNSTFYYQLNKLIQKQLVYVKIKTQPQVFDLTVDGFDYLKLYFPKILGGGASEKKLE